MMKLIQNQISTGNIQKGRGATNSSLFSWWRLLLLTVILVPALDVSAQSTISVKVFRHSTTGRYYGKVLIPKGGKYYVDFHPQKGVSTGVYAAKIDGENIYLSSARLLEDRYMIDATSTDMAFIVRSSAPDDIIVNPVPTELSDWMDANGYYYYDAVDARQNDLQYAMTAISNATLVSSSKYAQKRIYLMVNPANHDLAFAILNHQTTGRNLPANSLYLVSRKKYASARLNIVWVDEPDAMDEETTGIESVQTVQAPTDNTVYTLQGVRISEPVKGSLYIHNRRKYVAE